MNKKLLNAICWELIELEEIKDLNWGRQFLQIYWFDHIIEAYYQVSKLVTCHFTFVMGNLWIKPKCLPLKCLSWWSALISENCWLVCMNHSTLYYFSNGVHELSFLHEYKYLYFLIIWLKKCMHISFSI